MEEEKSIYISIPITGTDINKTMKRAEQIKGSLSHGKTRVVTPFDVVPLSDIEDMPEKEAYSYCLGKDIEALLNADVVFFCKGWDFSNGCRAEHKVAEIYHKELIFESEV